MAKGDCCAVFGCNINDRRFPEKDVIKNHTGFGKTTHTILVLQESKHVQGLDQKA